MTQMKHFLFKKNYQISMSKNSLNMLWEPATKDLVLKMWQKSSDLCTVEYIISYSTFYFNEMMT